MNTKVLTLDMGEGRTEKVQYADRDESRALIQLYMEELKRAGQCPDPDEALDALQESQGVVYSMRVLELIDDAACRALSAYIDVIGNARFYGVVAHVDPDGE